ncbi:hypothetical protein [Flavobacterium sp. J372]|nr:hypothetical protein [Flavobacterium sp. J372]
MSNAACRVETSFMERACPNGTGGDNADLADERGFSAGVKLSH